MKLLTSLLAATCAFASLADPTVADSPASLFANASSCASLSARLQSNVSSVSSSSCVSSDSTLIIQLNDFVSDVSQLTTTLLSAQPTPGSGVALSLNSSNVVDQTPWLTPAAAVFDNDPSTGWDPTGTPAYFTVDLGYSVAIASIGVMSSNDGTHTPYPLNIQISFTAAGPWTTVYSVYPDFHTNNQFQYITLNNTVSRYWKFQVTTTIGSYQPYINEVRFFRGPLSSSFQPVALPMSWAYPTPASFIVDSSATHDCCLATSGVNEVVDGDITTNWNTASGVNNYIVFDMHTNVTVTEVDVWALFDNAHVPANIQVATSNQATGPWSTVYASSSFVLHFAAPGPVVRGAFPLSPPSTSRYWRLFFASTISEYQLYLAEVKFYSIQSGPIGVGSQLPDGEYRVTVTDPICGVTAQSNSLVIAKACPTTTLAPTTPSTTLPPTTLPPTTLPPTTLPPTTLPPTTLPPTTPTPTTPTPTTPTPTTPTPTTLNPSTPNPSTRTPTSIPTTLTPSTLPPSTLPPSTLPPSTLPPSTLPPSTLPPSTLPPSTLPPSTLPPSTLPPSTLTPSTTATPSTASPATPNITASVWIKATSPATTCDFECNALGRSCVATAFSSVTSSSFMSAIAAQAGFVCPVISQGRAANTADPEFDATAGTCFYGGGVGVCGSPADANNYRFCPCSIIAPTILPTTPFPTTLSPTTPNPTTSSPTTSSGLILRSYQYAFSFFDVTFTSTPFLVSSSPHSVDSLIPALANMKGVHFQLASDSTTTVRYSVCHVAGSSCFIRDQLACTNTFVNSTTTDTAGDDASTYAAACGSRLFIPVQQSNVVLRVQANDQLFVFGIYVQLIN